VEAPIAATLPPPKPPPPAAMQNDPWIEFYESLSVLEKEALKVIIKTGDIAAFAASQNRMAEVLIDGINKKAMDTVSDTIMEYEIYPEYLDKLTDVINHDG
jgi:hypothetical protein